MPRTMKTRKPSDEHVLPELVLDGETIARLVRFSEAVGKPPRAVASELIRDLLADDEFWNAARTAALN